MGGGEREGRRGKIVNALKSHGHKYIYITEKCESLKYQNNFVLLIRHVNLEKSENSFAREGFKLVLYHDVSIELSSL